MGRARQVRKQQHLWVMEESRNELWGIHPEGGREEASLENPALLDFYCPRRAGERREGNQPYRQDRGH